MSTISRAKLVCVSVRENLQNGVKNGETVQFETRYNTEDSPEDNSYSIATPSASFSQWVTNPDLYGKYEEGKAYYFDCSPC